MTISGGSTAATKPVSRDQKIAPSVLGMISDRNRISSVSTADVTASTPDPHSRCASAPTPAAPTVWAIVFKLRIAASGRSIWVFSRRNRGRSPAARFLQPGDVRGCHAEQHGLENRAEERDAQRDGDVDEQQCHHSP